MSWTCDTRALGDAVRQAVRCAGRDGTMCLTGTATGVDVRAAAAQNTLRLHRSVTGDSTDTRTVVISPRLLASILDSLDTGTVTVTLDPAGHHLAVTGARANFELIADTHAAAPTYTGPGKDGVTVDGGALAVAAARVLPAVSTDPARPVLTGVLLEDLDDGLRMLATDSYRLGWADLPGTSLGEAGNTAIIPGVLLEEVTRNLKDAPVTVVVDETAVHFGTDDTWLSAGLISAAYPPYRKLLDITTNTVVHTTAETLIAALDTIAALLRHTASEPVRLTFTAGAIHATGASRDVGSSSSHCEAVVTGPELEMGFNISYLTSALKTVGGDIQIAIQDAGRPVLITPAHSDNGTGHGCLVMPVRLPAR